MLAWSLPLAFMAGRLMIFEKKMGKNNIPFHRFLFLIAKAFGRLKQR
jgi:hypothetical protein